MNALAMQGDLFTVDPQLPIARLHDENPRCLHDDDCHWERHQVDKGIWWGLGVGRTESGFFWTHEFTDNYGGCRGPVFIRPNPAPDFDSARMRAIQGLLFRLDTVYDGQSRSARKRLIAHIERTAA